MAKRLNWRGRREGPRTSWTARTLRNRRVRRQWVAGCGRATLGGVWRPGHPKSGRRTPWRSSRRSRPPYGSRLPCRQVASTSYRSVIPWNGSQVVLSTGPRSRAVASVTANPRVRLALGETRDAVIVEAVLVEAVPGGWRPPRCWLRGTPRRRVGTPGLTPATRSIRCSGRTNPGVE